MTASPLPAAGWFADPHDAARLRWWDGSAWTEHVHPPATQPSAAASTPIEASSQATALQVARDDAQWSIWPIRRTIDPIAPTVVEGRLARVLRSVGVVLANGKRTHAELVDWSSERGMQLTGGFDHAGRATGSPELVEQDLQPLRSAGLSGSIGAAVVLDGTPWRAAPDSRIAQFDVIDDRDRGSKAAITAIVVPLNPDVARRYAGWSVELGGRLRRSLGRMLFDRSAWSEVAFEQDSEQMQATVRCAPGQDQVALFELFEPTFLERLNAMADALPLGLTGAVVAHGRLVSWTSQAALHNVAIARDVGAEQIASNSMLHGLSRDIDVLAQLGADMHRQVVRTWT